MLIPSMIWKLLLLGLVVFFGSLYSHAFVVVKSPSSFRGRGGPIASNGVVANDGDVSFTEKLLNRLRQNDTSPIVVEGYVTSKRTIGKNLAFLDFQVDHGYNNDNGNEDSKYIDDNHNLCQVLLRKDIYQGRYYEGYRRCLLKGCKFKIEGTASATKIPGNAVLMLNSLELTALPRQSQHIQIILQQAKDGAIPFEDVMKACCYPKNLSGNSTPSLEIEKRILSLKPYPIDPTDINDDEDVDEETTTAIERSKREGQLLNKLAKDIISTLPDDPQYPIAADQKHLSKNGNFILPPVPKELQMVPERLQKEVSNEMMTTTIIHGKERTVIETLRKANNNGDNPIDTASEKVCIVGWVQNRRRFQGNVTMIYLQDDLNQDDSDRLPCIVHPDFLFQQQQQRPKDIDQYYYNTTSSSSENYSGIYQTLIAPDSKVRVEGRLVLPDENDANLVNGKESQSSLPLILWVEHIQLVRSSFRSVTIRHLLDLLYEKRMDAKEVSKALLIPYEEAKQLSFQSDATERQWKANQFAVQLQKEALNNDKMRTNKVQPVLLQVMEKYKFLSKIHPVISTDIREEEFKKNNDNGIDNKDSEMLMSKRRRVSVGMPGSKWQIKKKPQLEWMGRQIKSVLESHPDFKKRVLTIIDIGGGKGALANYLGRDTYLSKYVKVHVVDICKGAVMNGEKKAKRFDLPVNFQFADASNSDLLDAVEGDVVVALHACGHLSDIALAHAIHRRAGFVIVPCCFNSNPHLTIPVSGSSSSNIKQPSTTVPDWLGIPSSDWSALKLLAEVQDDIPLASEAIGIICAVRAEAAKKKILLMNDISKENIKVKIDVDVDNAVGNNNNNNDENIDESTDDNPSERKIEIRSFPIQYSTRNTVLVGMCS
ncbi:MAG: 2-polyprenyl-3-methyl-5-hydroxy-6-metoxy-1,4-benzoquinol methylase [Bacillariaceae sp.]|jgi:2-polyprenyl-3-methyl-5-hydroxy-6-metoxy-1,4-benzoquinol methylase